MLKQETDRARLVGINGVEEYVSVHEAARMDGHGLLCPTHAVVRGPGKGIVGAFSVGGCPLVTMWLGPAVRPRESFALIREVEGMVKGEGFKVGAVLVERKSPFFQYMGKMGYEERGDFVLFTKRTEDVG